jgi:hypothetical protein
MPGEDVGFVPRSEGRDDDAGVDSLHRRPASSTERTSSAVSVGSGSSGSATTPPPAPRAAWVPAWGPGRSPHPERQGRRWRPARGRRLHGCARGLPRVPPHRWSSSWSRAYHSLLRPSTSRISLKSSPFPRRSLSRRRELVHRLRPERTLIVPSSSGGHRGVGGGMRRSTPAAGRPRATG